MILRLAPAVVTAGLAATACGGAGPGSCESAGFAGGPSGADGVFAAAVPAACVASGQGARCTVADGSGPIVSEEIPPGVVSSCFAANQAVGSGLNQVEGYVTGECFGRAIAEVRRALARRVRTAPRPCRVDGPRSDDPGPAPPAVEPPAAGPAVIEGAAPDPHGRAPETGAVGDARPHPPPWGVLQWRARSGATCFEPGQVVDDRTPGRSDELPGVRARGTLRRERLVGALRPDSRSGTGIQLYGLGRFVPYPREDGGTCGRPDAGAGILVAIERWTARRDLTLGHTIVSGVAGPRVRAVHVDGRPLPIGPRRSFVAVLAGDSAHPRIEVHYASGPPLRLGAARRGGVQ